MIMPPTLKAEFRKLFTVRSTYIMIILSLAFIVLFNLYFEGYRGNTETPAATLAPNALQTIVANGAGMGALFASIIAALFMAHEYRYNTITYTLTANPRRTKVLFSKLFAVTVFSILFGFLAVSTALGSYMVGLSLRDASLPPQSFDVLYNFGKVAFYYAGYALIGILIATITRSVVGAIGALLIFSTILEPLLGLILKGNAKYLPITALDSTIGASIIQNVLSIKAAMLVSCAYLLTGLLAAWLLFTRRDAI